MGRPRPVPPALRVEDVSICANSWKIGLQLVGRDTHAGVLYADQNIFGSLPERADGDLAIFSEFDGVVDEIDHHLAQARAVGKYLHVIIRVVLDKEWKDSFHWPMWR